MRAKRWPMLGGASLLLTMIGASAWVNDVSWGPYVNYLGLAGILLVLYFWSASHGMEMLRA